MAIHEYRNNTHNRNAQSLSSLFTTFNANASSTLEDTTTTVAAVGTNDNAIPLVDTNDDAAFVPAPDNEDASHSNLDNDPEIMDDLFTFTTHQLMVAKLLSMLDAWNAPNYCFQQIVEWYEEGRKKDVSFAGHPVSRDANIKVISRSVPHSLASKLLPQTTTVDLVLSLIHI